MAGPDPDVLLVATRVERRPGNGSNVPGRGHCEASISIIWGTGKICKVLNADNLDFPAPLELMLDGKDMQQAEIAKSPYLERISEFKDALPGGDFPGDIIWCPEAETIYMFGIFNIEKELISNSLLEKLAELERRKREARKSNDREAFKKA